MRGPGCEAADAGDEDGALALGVMDHGGRIVVGAAARELRRALRPIEWVVLEDVALDACRDDAGALVATTSARRVAEHLGLTPGAVARALAALRSAGLVTHARQAGPAGRFGLSAYVLGAVPGLEVVAAAPEGDGPCPAPRPAPPHVKRPRAVDAHMEGAHAAIDEAPDVAGSARRSLHDHAARALATTVDDLASEERARSSRRRSSARSQRRPASQSAITQLSILDASVDAGHDTNPRRQP